MLSAGLVLLLGILCLAPHPALADCDDNDQACFQKEYTAIQVHQAQPGLSAAPCPLPGAPAGSIAFGPGRCIAISAPVHPGPWKIADIENIEGNKLAYCPSLKLSDQSGARPIAPPPTSFIHEATACCNLNRLESSADGKQLRLLSDLGRDCFGGATRSVFDETYDVDGNGLSLDQSRTQHLH
ncbi:MAG: hypothetical protein ABWY00_18150 [Dongiaceae bacterium]